MGEFITAKHTEGLGAGKVKLKIIDPAEFEGDSYKLNFVGKYDSLTYNLINTTKNDTLLKNHSEFGTINKDKNVTDGFIPFALNTGKEILDKHLRKYMVKNILEIAGPEGVPLRDSVNVFYNQDTSNYSTNNE